MAPPRTLVLVLAGGAGSRLELLTQHRAKPVVPYGGGYRLTDSPLSNCRTGRTMLRKGTRIPPGGRHPAPPPAQG